MGQDRIGLNCALSTPFTDDGGIDLDRLVGHARWVLANGCDSLTLFGTTGEGASIDLGGRHRALGALAGAGLDMGRQVVAGVAAATVEDAAAQARAGLDAGCRALLVAPPFYFGDVADDGVHAFFARLFERVGAGLRDVILYHIPGMTRVGLSVELVTRLDRSFPGVVIGVKDSNGDWAATRRRLETHPHLQVLVGDERQVAQAVRMGGAGTICGLANICPALLRPLAHDGVDDPRVGWIVDAILAHPFMPAIKALIADRLGDPGWTVMRPPLTPLAAADGHALAAAVRAITAAKAA
jgi:4-hydroxy-tetrahydrodipicolinate synthase